MCCRHSGTYKKPPGMMEQLADTNGFRHSRKRVLSHQAWNAALWLCVCFSWCSWICLTRPLLLSKILHFFVCFSQSLWHFTSTKQHSVILHMKIYALHTTHCFWKSDFSKKIFLPFHIPPICESSLTWMDNALGETLGLLKGDLPTKS